MIEWAGHRARDEPSRPAAMPQHEEQEVVTEEDLEDRFGSRKQAKLSVKAFMLIARAKGNEKVAKQLERKLFALNMAEIVEEMSGAKRSSDGGDGISAAAEPASGSSKADQKTAAADPGEGEEEVSQEDLDDAKAILFQLAGGRRLPSAKDAHQSLKLYTQHLLSTSDLAVPLYWKALNPELGVLSRDLTQSVDAQLQPELYSGVAQRLQRDGFFVSDGAAAWPAECSPSLLHEGMLRLRQYGLPPVFIFVFDAAWLMLRQMFEVASSALGSDCVMDDTFFAWLLRPRATAVSGSSAENTENHIGGNFGLPHRDFSFTESNLPDGTPKVVNVWVPVTDSTVDNGCMHVLPKEYDAYFNEPSHYNHLRAALPENRGRTSMSFSPCDSRPLPAVAGSVLCWQGNLVHWGGRCSQYAATPRASLAVSFRRADAEQWGCGGTITRDQMMSFSLSQRLEMISASLLRYGHWYQLPPQLQSAVQACRSSTTVAAAATIPAPDHTEDCQSIFSAHSHWSPPAWTEPEALEK